MATQNAKSSSSRNQQSKDDDSANEQSAEQQPGTAVDLLGLPVRDLAALASQLEEVKTLFGGAEKTPTRRRRPTDHIDDEDLLDDIDEDYDPDDIGFLKRALKREKRRNQEQELNQKRNSRRTIILTMLLNMPISLICMSLANWSDTVWYFEHNVMPHVNQFGIEKHENMLGYWMSAGKAREILEEEKEKTDALLAGDTLEGNARKIAQDEAYELYSKIRTMRENEAHYRQILDEYTREHGQGHITPEYFMERASSHRGRIIK